MKSVRLAAFGLAASAALSFGQSTFVVTGTAIPKGLIQQNYGRLPKGVGAYDLSICNVTDAKQSVVSSEIYQALSQSTADLKPIGRDIMLASILHNQNRSAGNIVALMLNSATEVLSLLSSSKYGVPPGVLTGAAVGSLAAQQIFSNLKPIFAADQVQKFENEVLEPALVLDGGSCVERTVFTAVGKTNSQQQKLSFHVR
jgi:hypothetical protein